MELVAKLPNVPLEALPAVAEHLRKLGAQVVFERPYAGTVAHPLGRLTFLHDGDRALSVFLATDLGFLPRKLLAGGIRQTVEESVKAFLKSRMPAPL